MRCWPNGPAIEVLDGSRYHGQLAVPYKRTREGWWLVFLSPDPRSIYLLLEGEFSSVMEISWR